MVNTLKPYFKQKAKNLQAEAEANGTAYGYYLVRESDGKRFFISKVVCVKSLEEVASKVLTDKDFDYWIDRSTGEDVYGNPCWVNLDFTDGFF